jgi:microcin C transport system substrate-binding protein
MILKAKGHPLITQLLRDFTGAKAADDGSVVATFAPNRARDVPLYIAGLPIFSRAYYATKPFEESTLDIPLGAGAYKVGRFEAGRFIEYQRVADWWGADLPVTRGQNNFDIVRYEFYRDREVGFVGFTAGNYPFREEFTSRATTFRRSRTAGSSATSCRTRRRPAGKAGSSTRGGQSSPIRGCAKRWAPPSISSGPTSR